MHFPKSARYFLHIALVLLVLAGIGNIHSHLCLDGQETTISVHFENLNGHPKHIGDKAHVDVDNELIAQVLPGKVVDQDAPLFLSVTALLFSLVPPNRQQYRITASLTFQHTHSAFLPPLRAPPALPA